jgi:hypothetical protein
MKNMRSAYRIAGGKPEGKGALERPKHRWDKIKYECKDVLF